MNLRGLSPKSTNQKRSYKSLLKRHNVSNAGMNDFEYIRKNLRDLMKYLPKGGPTYDTNFSDEILSPEWNESEL